MLDHSSIWQAIDMLAERHKLSTSALARLAGLDSTAFNKSKRLSKDGRKRWPSTESIAKALAATNEDFDSFWASSGSYSQSSHTLSSAPSATTVPLLGFAQAGAGGFFDSGGFPVGQGWDEVKIPGRDDESTYALEVSGDSMMPLYRDGDIIIISPIEQLRRGDRVVARTNDGEVMAKILHRQSEKQVELHSLNPEHDPRIIKNKDLDWIARILWASQ